MAKRSIRAAVVIPGLFAVADKVLKNPQIATFASIGAFSVLLLADFGGPLRRRLIAYTGLAVLGAVFITIATLASRVTWLAVVVAGRVGLVHVEDVAIGCAVSLVAGFLLWPRGAGPVVSADLADAFRTGTTYLSSAVHSLIGAHATLGQEAVAGQRPESRPWHRADSTWRSVSTSPSKAPSSCIEMSSRRWWVARPECYLPRIRSPRCR